MDWFRFKLDLLALTGLERDALHIYTGLLVQTLAAVVTRRSLARWAPWLAAAAAALLIEYGDWRYEPWPEERMLQATRALHDIVNTLIAPTFLLVLCRWFPGVVVRRDDQAASDTRT